MAYRLGGGRSIRLSYEGSSGTGEPGVKPYQWARPSYER